MAVRSSDISQQPEENSPVRPMFTARHPDGPEPVANDAPPSQYVLFERAPLRESRILQGAATRKLFALWGRQDTQAGLPLLSAFDSSGAADMLPFVVIHQVHRDVPSKFELVYAGRECCAIMGMSEAPRILEPGPDAINVNDVHSRLLDVVTHQHPHFCVKTLGWQGYDMTKYEALLLPFGEEGFDGVVAILSVLSFSNNFDPKIWMNSDV